MPVESNLIPDNWRERLAKVKAARARLENYYGDSDALAVLEKHIADEKWEIERFMHRRCSVLHPTVMYKKSAVLKSGNYQSVIVIVCTN